MTHSSVVSHVRISPNKGTRGGQEITKVTIHHMAGDLSVETCGSVFAPPSRQASSNYGVGSDGRVACYVEEEDRAWTSASRWNDQRAVTIEVANSGPGPEWPVSDKAWYATVDLVVDVIRRNPKIKRKDGRPGLWFDGTKDASLTMHEMFANTNCPGPYLKKWTDDFVYHVNCKLDGVEPHSEGSPAPAPTPAPDPAPAPSAPSGWSQWIADLQAECNAQGFSSQAVDGIYGPNTLAGCPMVRNGARGGITKLIQKRLISLGYSCGAYGADGVFGYSTKEAVRAFQMSHGLAADGIVGPNTWAALCQA